MPLPHAVQFKTVVYTDTHTCEQFLHLCVGYTLVSFCVFVSVNQSLIPSAGPLLPCVHHSSHPVSAGNDVLLSPTIHGPKYTHGHLTALFPGVPGWASTRKVKPVWILLKQETVSGSGISWTTCKSAPRSRQITTPAPHHSVFYRPDALPVVQPTNKNTLYLCHVSLITSSDVCDCWQL